MIVKGSTRLLVLVIALLVLSLGGFCVYENLQLRPLGKITISWNVWPGVLPILVAHEKGFFKEEGLDVDMIREDSYAKMIENFSNGKSDMVVDAALLDVVKNVADGEKIKVILAVDYSNGADGIVARRDIKSIRDLKGKKVAVEIGTLGEYLLHDALKKNNLDSFKDILEVNLSAQEAAQAFIRGDVDAAVTYEPDFSLAAEKGNGWRIYTSADSPGLITDVMVVSADFLKQNPDKISAVVRAYSKAMDNIKSDPDKAFAIGATYFKITPKEFKGEYAGLKQVSVEENLNIMRFAGGLGSLHGMIRRASQFLSDKRIIDTGVSVDSTDIIAPNIIRQLDN